MSGSISTRDRTTLSKAAHILYEFHFVSFSCFIYITRRMGCRVWVPAICMRSEWCTVTNIGNMGNATWIRFIVLSWLVMLVVIPLYCGYRMVELISTTAAIPYLFLSFPRVYQSPICDSHNTMAETKLKPAILIISDTASQNPASDKTVNVLSTSFAVAGPGTWESPVTKIVPDSVLDIQRAICDWTDGPDWFNLILLSGGTGFAVKDNTPEVCWCTYNGFHVLTGPGRITARPSPCAGSCVSHETLSLQQQYND